MKAELITWDHTEQPDWHSINMALELFGRPAIVPVETEADHYAVVVIDSSQRKCAQAFYNVRMQEMGGEA